MCQSLHRTLKTTGRDVIARGVHQYVQNVCDFCNISLDSKSKIEAFYLWLQTLKLTLSLCVCVLVSVWVCLL